MKTHLIRTFLLFTLALSLNLAGVSAQMTDDPKINDEIKSLESEIKAKQKQILELKVSKLKQQQEEIQNELNTLKSPTNGSSKESATQANNIVARPSFLVGEFKKEGMQNIATPTGGANPALSDEANDSKCNPLIRSNLDTFDRNICDLAREFIANSSIDTKPKNIAVLTLHMAQVDVNVNIKALISKFEDTRTDKQVGGDSSGKGTTSLAVKGGAPKLVGWAVESGAATSTVLGNTVNIRINPIGLFEALARSPNSLPFGLDASLNTGPTFSVERSDDAFTRFASRASVGFAFDITRGTDPPTFIGSKQQLSAVSFRYEFINKRDPLRKEFSSDWNTFFRSQIANYTGQMDAVKALIEVVNSTDVIKNAQLRKWVADTQTELLALPKNAGGQRDFTAVRVKIEERLKVLPINEVLKDEIVKDALTNLAKHGVKYSQSSKDFLNKLNKGTIVTFEYTNNREVNAPDTSKFNFIAEFGRKIGDGVMDITFNGSMTIFNKTPQGANVQRIKNFDFTGQADFPVVALGNSILSFSGKVVRQPGDVVLPNGVVANGSKGNIAIGQIKFTIPVPGWGIRFPLAVTFANRTELIKEGTVRGNFGITFDLDSIFGKKRIL